MSLIEFRNITRQIGSCIACSDVSLSIEKGHVHAIIGENGAGKSTLVKMLGGVAEITSGQIYLDSKNYRPR
ncbi:MAG: ATP-binding cassette domain-containing protein, partial [Bdellovibrionaceae bacterium]|nr:ATP-binding cassette domain-containing protein [Pseudobdellovibrionaceae bacterium]